MLLATIALAICGSSMLTLMCKKDEQNYNHLPRIKITKVRQIFYIY